MRSFPTLGFQELGRNTFGDGIQPGVIVGGVSDPYPGITVYDQFTDTNSVLLTAHTPNKSPAAWVATSGVMDIQSNKASYVSGTGIQTIDCGISDCTISCVVTTGDGGVNDQCGISFRVQDATHRWLGYLNNQGNTVNILKLNPGVTVVQTTAMALVNATQYVLEVVLSGTTMDLYVDGVLKCTHTENLFTTVTKHGLYGAKAGHVFDNFQVTP